MEVTKGVTLDYKQGEVVLTAKAYEIVKPLIEGFKAKVESGEIDPIKGTDLDKTAILGAVELLQKYLAA